MAAIVQAAGRTAANALARIHARATRSGMFGVHRIYDFALSVCAGQPSVSAPVATVTDLAATDLASGSCILILLCSLSHQGTGERVRPVKIICS
jgi:hypothetical protein